MKLNAQTVRNLIDRRELGAVRIGPRRVRVRQSQLDEFLAVGEGFYADAVVVADGSDPWVIVRPRLAAVRSAVAAKDRDAVDVAVRELKTAAETLPAGE